jgi:hypothetical protein
MPNHRHFGNFLLAADRFDGNGLFGNIGWFGCHTFIGDDCERDRNRRPAANVPEWADPLRGNPVPHGGLHAHIRFRRSYLFCRGFSLAL